MTYFTGNELRDLVRKLGYLTTIVIDIGEEEEEKHEADVGYFVELDSLLVFACKWVDNDELFPLLWRSDHFEYGGRPCRVPKAN